MKRLNPRRVKIHRTYTIAETARLLRVHRKTVQRWIKKGLPTCDDSRPILILGRDLRDFLGQQRAANKQNCGTGQLYCVRCRAPKAPAGGMVDFILTTAGSGYLQGICPDCTVLIHRAVPITRLRSVAVGLEVAFPRAMRRLGDTSPALVNVHFGREAHIHANP